MHLLVGRVKGPRVGLTQAWSQRQRGTGALQILGMSHRPHKDWLDNRYGQGPVLRDEPGRQVYHCWEKWHSLRSVPAVGSRKVMWSWTPEADVREVLKGGCEEKPEVEEGRAGKGVRKFPPQCSRWIFLYLTELWGKKFELWSIHVQDILCRKDGLNTQLTSILCTSLV